MTRKPGRPVELDDPRRLNAALDPKILAAIDRHRGARVSRAAALREELQLLIERLEAGSRLAIDGVAPTIRPFHLAVPGALLARAQALVNAGRASSVTALVRAAGEEFLGRGR